MEKLKIIGMNKKEELFYESTNAESCINRLITTLYDGIIKRAKVESTQYYVDGYEYCRITGTYNDGTMYIISGVRNDWGDFINIPKTLIDNNISIKGE